MLAPQLIENGDLRDVVVMDNSIFLTYDKVRIMWLLIASTDWTTGMTFSYVVGNFNDIHRPHLP